MSLHGTIPCSLNLSTPFCLSRRAMTAIGLPLLCSLFGLGSINAGQRSAEAYVTTLPSRARHSETIVPKSNRRTSLFWSDGKNAAPAIICEVENVPILEPIPKGFKRLFMVRHGEVINPGVNRPVYYGSMDVPLSPLGELEAIEAGAYLSKFKLQHVASSPLSRAHFGARQVMSRQTRSDEESNDSKDIIVYNGFTELNRGAWCGKTKDEIGVDNLARFDACDESVTPDGGESYPTLKARVLKARDELLQITDAGRASAIVSHLQVTRAMLSEALGMDIKEMAGLQIKTASISCVDYCLSSGKEYVRFQSFKPECGLKESKDGAN